MKNFGLLFVLVKITGFLETDAPAAVRFRCSFSTPLRAKGPGGGPGEGCRGRVRWGHAQGAGGWFKSETEWARVRLVAIVYGGSRVQSGFHLLAFGVLWCHPCQWRFCTSIAGGDCLLPPTPLCCFFVFGVQISTGASTCNGTFRLFSSFTVCSPLRIG